MGGLYEGRRADESRDGKGEGEREERIGEGV